MTSTSFQSSSGIDSTSLATTESVRSRLPGSSSSDSSSMRSNRKGMALDKRVALGHQQQAVQLAVLVAGEFHVGDLAAFKPGKLPATSVGGVGDDFRQTAFAARQHTVAVVEVVVDLHVAQRGETVEPGVGDRLHGLRKAVLLHALDQAFALFMHLGRPGLPGDERNVALLFAGRDVQREPPFRTTRASGRVPRRRR
jgi:hypothetical protein